MNGYILLKASVINGEKLAAGSLIPADAVLPSRVPALLKNGVIAETNIGATEGAETTARTPEPVEGIEIPINTEDGVLGLPASREDILKAFEVLQMKVEDASDAVKAVETENALILIDACTKNSTLKKAIRNRVTELKAEGGDE